MNAKDYMIEFYTMHGKYPSEQQIAHAFDDWIAQMEYRHESTMELASSGTDESK